MLKKSFLILFMVAACKASAPPQGASSKDLQALKIQEAGGFTGGFGPIKLRADGTVLNTQGLVADTLSPQEWKAAEAIALEVQNLPSYEGVEGNVMRSMDLYIKGDSLQFYWSLEDTSKTAKTLNESFGRLSRILN